MLGRLIGRDALFNERTERAVATHRTTDEEIVNLMSPVALPAQATDQPHMSDSAVSATVRAA